MYTLQHIGRFKSTITQASSSRLIQYTANFLSYKIASPELMISSSEQEVEEQGSRPIMWGTLGVDERQINRSELDAPATASSLESASRQKKGISARMPPSCSNRNHRCKRNVRLSDIGAPLALECGISSVTIIPWLFPN